MLKSILVLPDGTRLSSGPEDVNPIMQITLTEEVNDQQELMPGAVVASILEATVLTPRGNLRLEAGQEVTLLRQDEDGRQQKQGVYILETPSRDSAHSIRFTAFDRITKLDKDLSGWLEQLEAWPYRLDAFARMVCRECGVNLITEQIPNGDLPVPPFGYPHVTGRQILNWIGQLCGCFCKADPEGDLELKWYTPWHQPVTAGGNMARDLTYETYQVAPVEAVQLRLTEGDRQALWPEAGAGENAMVISGNPIALADVSAHLLPYLETVGQRMAATVYTPCRMTVPADLQIPVGSLLQVTDSNGKTFTTCVMRKVSTAHWDSLESTGSPRMDSPSAANNRSDGEQLQQMMLAVRSLDGEKVVSLINLSEEGVKIKGDKIRLEGTVTANGNFKVLTDGSVEMAGKITADSGRIGTCEIEDGKLVVKDSNGLTLLSAGNNAVKMAGWSADDNSLYSGESFSEAECFLCTGSRGSLSIGNSGKIPGWMIKAGEDFGVTQSGEVYASDIHISGGSMVIPLADTLASGEVVETGYAVMDIDGIGATNVGMFPGEFYGSAIRLRPGGIYYQSELLGEERTMIYSEESNMDVNFHLAGGTWYIDALGSPAQVTSDRNAKLDIQEQPEIYCQLFDRLQPVVFRYKNGKSGRLHTGFIAQDVENAVLSLGLTTQDFAGVCYDLDENGNKTRYGIRYEEFVSMNTWQIQQLKRRIGELEAAVEKLQREKEEQVT